MKILIKSSYFHSSKFILCLATCVLLLISCQKVVDINLNSTSPRIVIEANISNLSGPYFVKISKTVNYNETNVFPAVSGALVTISDDAGNSELLNETAKGTYKTSVTLGVPERTYTLTVNYEGQNYTATCIMHKQIPIDKMVLVKTPNFRGGISNNILLTFSDPAGIENYYRFEEIVNGKKSRDFHVYSDRLHDGETIEYTYRNDPDSVKMGDSVEVMFESIDKSMYYYFRELDRAVNSSGLQAAPANPDSNFNNGALGYFNAYAVSSKKIRIP